jgi:hypothetical protein
MTPRDRQVVRAQPLRSLVVNRTLVRCRRGEYNPKYTRSLEPRTRSSIAIWPGQALPKDRTGAQQQHAGITDHCTRAETERP